VGGGESHNVGGGRRRSKAEWWGVNQVRVESGADNAGITERYKYINIYIYIAYIYMYIYVRVGKQRESEAKTFFEKLLSSFSEHHTVM
jgi:hypothetical protein